LKPAREKLLIGLVLASVLAALAVGALLAANPRLTPGALGYPGCLFRAVLGIPCPACGGFSALSMALRGELRGAWDANPFAVLLLATMLVAVPALLVALVWPGSVVPLLRSRAFRVAALAWGAVLLFTLVFSWIARLL